MNTLTKQLTEYEIMEIIESVEQIIADNLNDYDTYNISVTDTDVNYNQICLYAMHEIITINSSSKHKLFLSFKYSNDTFTAVINNDVKNYFKTLK